MSLIHSLTVSFILLIGLPACISQNIPIPLSVWKDLSQVKNYAEFNRIFLKGKGPVVLLPRRNSKNIRTSYSEPLPCEPRPTIVAVPRSANPGILRFPLCVSVNRCGGCCGSHQVHCMPKSKTMREIAILEAEYLGGNRGFTFPTDKVLEFEMHTKCECECKVQAHHCDKDKHTYSSGDCQCQCKNAKEESRLCTPGQKWDAKTCSCVCINVELCCKDVNRLKYIFSNITCKCEPPKNVNTESRNKPGSRFGLRTMPRTTVRTTAPVANQCIHRGCSTDYVPCLKRGRCSCCYRNQCIHISCRTGYKPCLVANYCQCCVERHGKK